jgi:hypothetical protein
VVAVVEKVVASRVAAKVVAAVEKVAVRRVAVEAVSAGYSVKTG